jgi:hypothetical protein
VTSLVAGILGLTIFWGLGSLVAVITGTVALREIAAQPALVGGAGTARAGLVLGWIGIGVTLVIVCAACAFFLLLLPAFGLLSRSAEPTSQMLPWLIAL